MNIIIYITGIHFSVYPQRRGWDSNPRALADKRFSRPPRYDHFDTSPNRICLKESFAFFLLCIRICFIAFDTTKRVNQMDSSAAYSLNRLADYIIIPQLMSSSFITFFSLFSILVIKAQTRHFYSSFRAGIAFKSQLSRLPFWYS